MTEGRDKLAIMWDSAKLEVSGYEHDLAKLEILRDERGRVVWAKRSNVGLARDEAFPGPGRAQLRPGDHSTHFGGSGLVPPRSTSAWPRVDRTG